MTAKPSPPPRLARRLLRAILPPTIAGSSAVGDLIEEFHRRPAGPGRRLWFWLAAADLLVRYSPGRISSILTAACRDVLYAARLARRQPGLTLATLLTLSLAVGAGTAAFTVANSAWLRPALAADPSIVATWRVHKNGASKSWPAAELYALRDRARLRTIEGGSVQTLPMGRPLDSWAQQPARVLFVTGSYLSTFAASLEAGRLLEPADDRPGARPVIVLGQRFWRRAFGADRSVIGQIVRLRDVDFTVVGIVRRDYVDPGDSSAQAWASVAAHGLLTAASGSSPPPVFMVGRVKPQHDLRQADAELAGLISTLPPGSPPPPPAVRAESNPVVSAEKMSSYRLLVGGSLCVIGLVLLLACTNVANLQLAAAASRRHEIAVRQSCGASRFRLIRQLATEHLLWAVVAGACGFILAKWLAPLMAVGMNMPAVDLEPDARVYLFASAMTILTAVGTGLVPAFQGSRADVSLNLKGRQPDAGRLRVSRTKSIFLGVQAATSIVIIAMAALLVRSLVHLAWLDPGYDVDRLLNVSASFPHNEQGVMRAGEFWTRALERVRTMPGVEAAALGYAPPFGVSLGDPDQVLTNSTDETYFAVLGMRLVSGRTYTAAEVAARAPVMLVSERVARNFWRDENPVGSNASRIDKLGRCDQIIGVVADSMAVRVHGQGAAVVYTPGVPPDWAQMTVRASDPRAVGGAIREVLSSISADVRPNVLIVKDRFAREFETPRRQAGLAAGVGALTLVLSIVGLTGVTMFSVRTRTREIGIRMALGARRQEVLALLVRDGMRAVIIGLVAGLICATLTTRFLSGMLYGLSPRDPLALCAAVAALLVAELAAVVLPTRRAATLDPARVLRES